MASDRVALMETISGCTVMRPSEASEPVRIGPSEISGAFVVEVGMFPASQPGPPLHLHPHTDEMFYIADGDATFQLGDSQFQLSGGALVIVPRGITHTVWNSGDRPLRGLIVISPGDVEHEFVPAETG
jgi:mannose-6-phosphate isomerase-like protein (cupin superfamily)